MKVTSKENVKLAAERFRNVEFFVYTLERVADDHDDILDDPDRIVYLEESKMNCTIGRMQQVFTAAGKRNGGAREIMSPYVVSKHITAVIAASATGMLTPPFIVVNGL